MVGACQTPRHLLACLVVLCALATSAVGQAPGGGPPPMAAPNPVFAAPAGDAGCVGCQTAVPPFLSPPTEAGVGPWQSGPEPRPWIYRQLDLRHSSTHGRAMGPGEPLRGTSWSNRPVALSLDGGALLMGNRVAANVRANNDLLAAVGLGWDFDHYWGAQVRVAWSSPELLNTTQTALVTDNTLFISDFSLLYYPWGDSRLRPYYRVGVGLTDVAYTNDFGLKQNDSLYTMPLAVGLKYQINPKIAWRLEFADNIAIGQNETSTLNNLTITTGLEWRLGGPPPGYWAWAPRTGGW
ncbi:hypothetical protein Pla108_30750 [Botrimarina colliarenosi]|uniref:Outer membrane protein beta-barrel domain-containing protein n=1 Tax=Botrimarina colliarenosi TaxID=2528001 RepID=A0A5C6A984_9BACT|nr:outer membrane beta-barrel protein [Botrimarina colliarenosi]TWT95996.1 hypothetical protein Pla108_30750 [Botrimarina colliarenosi]